MSRYAKLLPTTMLLSAALVSWLYLKLVPDVGYIPASAQGGQIYVAPADTSLAGHDISGWRDSQIRGLLKEWAKEVQSDPMPTRIDPVTKGVIPGINGLEIDIEGSMARLHSINSPGQHVDLAFKEIPPPDTGQQEPYGPIYQGNPGKHAVTFVINVAWGNEFLPRMLETLKNNGVKATFFLMGDWAEKNADAAAKIASEGHEIASHGYSAAEFRQLGTAELIRQIDKSTEAITSATGQKPKFFSPHKGEITPQLVELLRQKNYQLVLWSVDTVDWARPGVDAMVNKILAKSHNGALILMHPTDQTVQALEPMILGLRSKGFRIVTLGTLLNPSPLAKD